MEINFLGAAQNVTGSKHLLKINGFNLLLDCGFYQGKRQLANELNKNLPFDSKSIDAVILSHAHLDHCGTLPMLAKKGFAGKIYCTRATAEIAKYILLDSAAIQFQDAQYLNKHLKRGEQEVEPAYLKEDVEKALELFYPVEYFLKSRQWVKINDDIKCKFYDAGHILGSAMIVLEINDNGQKKTLAYTGDLGRQVAPILRTPEVIQENLNVLISECTYGDRVHKPAQEAWDDLKTIINQAVENKSKIIVPAFSLGRTQEIIYMLHKLFDQKAIPEFPVYIDSPLAENITQVFSKYTDDFDEDFWKDFGSRGDSPFELKNLRYVQSVEESKSLNKKEGPLMIISASGMAEAGRVLHHLKNNVEDSNNIIMIIGYQAENTLGRRLQEHISPVKIYGTEYPVRAKVITLPEFSAHADQHEMLDYISKLKISDEIFLVHTEMDQAQTFKKLLGKQRPELKIEIPKTGQTALI